MSDTLGQTSRVGRDNRYAWLNQATSLIATERMVAVAEKLGADYKTAEPFPHVVVDSLFDDDLLDELLAVFPTPKTANWARFDAEREIKLALYREDLIPPPIRLFLYFLNGSVFLNFLEHVTGIPGLIPDPHLFGGGLHQIERGGKLAMHADFNRQERLRLDRRLNLLLYLNKDWATEYGGDLELWDRDMTHCVQKIAPLFNRMVIFSTTDTSFHGHPDPLRCPANRYRRSLALYYYTNGRPDEEVSGMHSTVFKPRPGETFKKNLRRQLHPYVPPVVFQMYDRLIG